MKRRDRKLRLHREPIVRRVAAILATGWPSKFAYEGACRAGLRSRLCLAGQKWAAADKWAGLVVVLALHRIGAARPDWLHGQPEAPERYTETWNCHRCGRRIDPESTGLGRRYCSDLCSDNARAARYRASLQNEIDASRAAFRAAQQRGENPTRKCEACGRAFEVKPTFGGLKQKYCSAECTMAVRRKYDRRACLICGALFQPRTNKQRYCSPEHAAQGAIKPREARVCVTCGDSFYPRFPSRPTTRCEVCRNRKSADVFACEAAE